MKKMVLCVVSTAVVVLLAASGLQAADEIRVGVVLPLTGSQASFGEIERNSFIMGVEKINKTGGVNGRKIELIFEDDTGKPDVGRSAVEKLISKDKVAALTGGYSSSVTYAICPVAQQRKVPFLVTTGSAEKITEQGWDYVFRISPPVSEYPKALSSFLTELVQPKTVVILYENTLFGQSGAKEFGAQCEREGMSVILKEGYEHGAVDFKPLLIKVKAAKPDLVYMISYVMDAALLMRQAKELDLHPKLFVGGGAGFTLPEFAKTAGDAAQYVFSTTLWVPTLPYAGAQEYYDEYVKRFKSETDYHGAEAYASIQVLADVLNRANEISHAAVREAMVKTNVQTVFGPVKFISYDKKKQQNSLPTYLVQWQDGVLETVWPKNVATKPYVYPVPPWSKK